MEAARTKTLRKPPPPPPRRHQESSAETPSNSQAQVPTRKNSCEESSSVDSGISTSSSSSSLPSTASLEITVNDHDAIDYSRTFNSTAFDEDSPFLREISLALQNSSLASVLSLPQESSAKDEEIELERTSTSLIIPRKAAPKPPVRRDSIRSEPPRNRKSSSKYKLEERFASQFHSYENLPSPPPFTNCQKTYPTKELFGDGKKDEQDSQEVPKPEPEVSSKSRRSENVFSKMFSLKTSLTSRRTSVSPKPNVSSEAR